jgi:hypothetical protein
VVLRASFGHIAGRVRHPRSPVQRLVEMAMRVDDPGARSGRKRRAPPRRADRCSARPVRSHRRAQDVRRSLKAPPPAATQQHVRHASPASTSRRRRARSGPSAGHSASRAAGGHDGKLNAREPQPRPAAYAGRINVHRRAVHLPSVSFPSIRSVGLVIGPMDPELRVQHLRSVPAPRLALGGGNEPCSPGAIAVRLAANELHPCACTSVVDHLWRGAYLASDDVPETRLKGPGRAHLRPPSRPRRRRPAVALGPSSDGSADRWR